MYNFQQEKPIFTKIRLARFSGQLKVPNLKKKTISVFTVDAATTWTIGSLSNHDDDGNKNPTNLHICMTMKNSIFACFARGLFIF